MVIAVIRFRIIILGQSGVDGLIRGDLGIGFSLLFFVVVF